MDAQAVMNCDIGEMAGRVHMLVCNKASDATRGAGVLVPGLARGGHHNTPGRRLVR